MNDLGGLKKGVDFLLSCQKEDGSFFDFLSTDKDFNNLSECSTTFSTSLILSSLSELPETERINKIKKKAARFLLNEKSDFWTFNYWAKGAEEFKRVPYPDDLDDTACALSALFRCDESVVDGSAFASFAQVLTALEVKEGGPYRTWLVSEVASKKWKDVDLAVNANIGYFLKLQDIDLPSLEKLVEQSIVAKKLKSPYYESEMAVIYFVSRFYKGRMVEDLIKVILEKKNPKSFWGNPLDTAFGVSSLINLGADLDLVQPSLEYLADCVEKNDWQAFPLVGLRLEKGGDWYYGGSPALTAAFCLEALAKYEKAIRKTITLNLDVKETLYCKDLVLKRARKRFKNPSKVFDKNVADLLTRVTKNDSKSQVTLLPYFFYTALGKDFKGKISEETILNLCLFSLFGWMAYTIYDDFFDEEGRPDTLPLANICLRKLTQIIGSVFGPDDPFQKVFSELMDRMEGSNYWETSCCRIRIEGKKAKLPQALPNDRNSFYQIGKSVGHAIGPLAVLYLAGYGPSSLQFKNTLGFLENYIGAKQTSDDVHDWEEDLKKGILTRTVCNVLKAWTKKHPERKSLDLEKDFAEFQEIFWHQVIDGECEIIKKDIVRAKICLKKVRPLENKEYLLEMVDDLSKMAEKTLAERNRMVEFLKTYSG